MAMGMETSALACATSRREIGAFGTSRDANGPGRVDPSGYSEPAMPHMCGGVRCEILHELWHSMLTRRVRELLRLVRLARSSRNRTAEHD